MDPETDPAAVSARIAAIDALAQPPPADAAGPSAPNAVVTAADVGEGIFDVVSDIFSIFD